MEAERRKYALLGALALVLVVVAYRVWPSGTSAATSQSSSRQGGRSGTGRATTPAEAPDVHLKALETDRPRPGLSERNLFRFRPKAPPPPSSPIAGGPTEALVATGLPRPPPPPSPIPFKFIGIVDAAAQAAKIAVLSDGRNVFHGREGDIIEGRYQIVHIGAESVEMAYLDGRGRQSIRLTGS